MKIAVCIPTRGRPALLQKTLTQTLAMANRPETVAVVGLDTDDSTAVQTTLTMRSWVDVRLSIGLREDTLGAKYNRLARAIDADLYVLGVDKMAFATEGWDDILAERASGFKDGIGVIGFGKPPVAQPVLPASFAVTSRMVKAIGFMTELFPFWWHDMWLTEVAEMIGRLVPADIEMAYPENPIQTRGARDVAFWAHFYDSIRSLREAQARMLISSLADPWARKEALLDGLVAWRQEHYDRNAICRDPGTAAEVEKVYGFDAPNDERYQRVLRSAAALIHHLLKQKEDAHVAA